MAGSFPSANSTSRTGPMTWTTRPTFASAIRGVLLLVTGPFSFQSRRPGDDLDQFLGDPRLAGAVVVQGQRIDHVSRVLRRRVHRGHARGVLGRRGLEQDLEDDELQVPRQETGEDR